MSPFRNNLKTPEEIELAGKYQQLALLKSELRNREAEYANLKSEIRVFEQVYEEILGTRIEVLEELEWQLKGLLGEDTARQLEKQEQVHTYTHFHNTTDLLDEDDEQLQPGDPSVLSLKALYRGVAKSVHPDLATDESERQRRQELMALANDAYQSGNRQVLIDLLSEWEQPIAFAGSEVETALELVRVIRQVAAVRQNTQAVVRQMEELKNTDIYHFKLKVDDSLADGIDLLAEMAAAVDLDILKIRRRLAVAMGESGLGADIATTHCETRVVRFPDNFNCGMLYVRNQSSIDFRDWRRIGAARGAKEVFLDTSLRLDIKAEECVDTSFLTTLGGNDIQALFIYGGDDSLIGKIAHLTGLYELYLSDMVISDKVLSLLYPLKALQRISLYHTPVGDGGLFHLSRLTGLRWLTCSGTAITEEGFNTFRRVMPGCKTVSFKWRYQDKQEL